MSGTQQGEKIRRRSGGEDKFTLARIFNEAAGGYSSNYFCIAFVR